LPLDPDEALARGEILLQVFPGSAQNLRQHLRGAGGLCISTGEAYTLLLSTLVANRALLLA
jgi:hypothetical protein